MTKFVGDLEFTTFSILVGAGSQDRLHAVRQGARHDRFQPLPFLGELLGHVQERFEAFRNRESGESFVHHAVDVHFASSEVQDVRELAVFEFVLRPHLSGQLVTLGSLSRSH